MFGISSLTTVKERTLFDLSHSQCPSLWNQSHVATCDNILIMKQES